MTRAYHSDNEDSAAQRFDAATDAASAVAWALVETPSAHLHLSWASKQAYAMRAASLLNKYQDAMGDPKQFVETLFGVLSHAVDDFNYDARNDDMRVYKEEEPI